MTTENARPPAKTTPGFVVFVGLATFGVMQVVGSYFVANATASVVLQALIAEVGAGRGSVTWSMDAKDKRRPFPRIAMGAAWGAAAGATAMFLLDPDQGRRRRGMLIERARRAERAASGS